jgi:LAO/AO transport system kinase
MAAKAITQIEENGPYREALLQFLYPHTGRAYIIGITGAPGAGKSSLVNRLISFLRSKGLSVGVVAVDPTSPFTGGALLGDRVRMQEHALDSGVFVRSMGTRGSLGGLARASKEAVRVLDAQGKEVILVETVGVGQSELDVMHLADSTVVVLTPGAGDTVQAFKAGIMEIADLFVVNKADLDGANKLVAQVNAMLDLVKAKVAWRPPIVKTVAHEDRGIEDLWEALCKHRQFIKETGEWERRRKKHLREEVLEIAELAIVERMRQTLRSGKWEQLLGKVEERELNPYEVANHLVGEILGKDV